MISMSSVMLCSSYFSRTFIVIAPVFVCSVCVYAMRHVFKFDCIFRHIIIGVVRSVWHDYQSIFFHFFFGYVLMRTKHVIDIYKKNILFHSLLRGFLSLAILWGFFLVFYIRATKVIFIFSFNHFIPMYAKISIHFFPSL